MGVFTLDASHIKEKAGYFACSHPVWIGPKPCNAVQGRYIVRGGELGGVDVIRVQGKVKNQACMHTYPQATTVPEGP